MPQVKDIKILNFNEKAYSVEDMSQAIQNLVYHYNNANKKDAELTDDLILIRTAKEQILAQVRTQFETEQKEAAEKAAAAATPVPTPAVDSSVVAEVPASTVN